MDCGPACLKMLCDYYGKKISLRYIKESMAISRIGATMQDLIGTADELGFETLAIACNAEKLKKIPIPIILYWKAGHFIICYRVRTNHKGETKYYVADPACGKVVMTEEEMIEAWATKQLMGYGLLVQPGDDFETKKDPHDIPGTNILQILAEKYKRYGRSITLVLTLMLVSIGCSWIVPVLYEKIINLGVMEGNLKLIWELFFLQLAFFMGYILSDSFSAIVVSKVNFKISLDYLSGLLRKIIRLPLKYFDTRLNTEFLQRMDDYYKLQEFLTNHLITTFFALLNLIVFSALLAWYTWQGLLIFLVMSLISGSLVMIYLPRLRYVTHSFYTMRARNRNILNEIVNGMSDIKANNAEDKHIQKWTDNQETINDLFLSTMLFGFKQSTINSTLNRLRDILVVGFCAYLTVKGQLTLGGLMSVSYILGQLSVPISRIQGIPKMLLNAGISAERLSEIQLRTNESEEQTDDKQPPLGDIRLKDVKFKYEGSFNPYIFDGLSMTIERNKTTALVGNSGSGKTTLIKLLLGFYHPQEGQVSVGGVLMNEIDLEVWRRKCGMVLQDGKIFSMTAAENIALGDKEPNISKVIFCAKMACIHDFLSKLPMGYDTRLGGAGLELSQGQKQRVLIARAIYKDPELIILDEATSSLDTVNERKIMDNLTSFFQNRTVVIVAHRLSTVVNADKIIYLEDGKIAEQGPHRDLVSIRGKYYELIRNQLELER